MVEQAEIPAPLPYSELTLRDQLTRRRDALIAAARAIPVSVLDTEDDPVLCSTKRQLLEAAGRLFLVIQSMERKGVNNV